MSASSASPRTPAGVRRRRRRAWLAPLIALALAGLAVGLAVLGHARVTAAPDEPLRFVVADDLPQGITQQSVEAAAEDRPLTHEPLAVSAGS